MAFNKTDLKRIGELQANKKAEIEQWLTENNLKFIEISTLKMEHIIEAKEMACELVFNIKLPQPESKVIKTEQNYINGIYVSHPKKRDNVQRPSTTVDLSKKVQKEKSVRQLEE